MKVVHNGYDIYDTLNPCGRRQSFKPEGPLLFSFSAWGRFRKDQVLTHRVAYLIEEKQVNRLEYTGHHFTNKAAGEMGKVDQLVGLWG